MHPTEDEIHTNRKQDDTAAGDCKKSHVGSEPDAPETITVTMGIPSSSSAQILDDEICDGTTHIHTMHNVEGEKDDICQAP